MQGKTIARNIKMKMEEWISSIDDKDLRKDVRNNLLVSWGSITSMFLNEDVNDYDVYIKDMDVLIRLCEYYCSPHCFKVLDGRKKEEYLSELDRWDFEDQDEDLSQEIIFHRNLKGDQVKLLVWSAWAEVCHEWDTDIELPKYRLLFLSPNAISLSDDIQIVCRFHWGNEAIHKTFDFVHATNYYTFEDGLVTNKEAVESILTKQLKYQGSLYPLTSVIRMKKFIKRWWNISAWEMLKTMFQISELDLKDPNILEDQLIGVDIAYFSALIDTLRGKKDWEVSSEYLNKMIDKVFNDTDED